MARATATVGRLSAFTATRRTRVGPVGQPVAFGGVYRELVCSISAIRLRRTALGERQSVSFEARAGGKARRHAPAVVEPMSGNVLRGVGPVQDVSTRDGVTR